MKALQKDRRRRYATALELGQDVRRYLDDEPVEASPPSLLYRASKLARKHRAALSIAAGAALMLAGTALVSSWLLLRTPQDERLAPTMSTKPRWIVKDHQDVAWCVAFYRWQVVWSRAPGNRECDRRRDSGIPSPKRVVGRCPAYRADPSPTESDGSPSHRTASRWQPPNTTGTGPVYATRRRARSRPTGTPIAGACNASSSPATAVLL